MKRNYLLTLLCVLVAISVNAELRTQPVERFNSTTTFDGTDLNKVSNGVYSNSANHVTFTIDNLHSYDGERLRFNNVGSNSSKTSNFAWTTESGYNVQVTGISGKVRGYQSKVFTKGAYAKFNSGNEVKCNTNNLGTGGAVDISISDGSGLSKPVVLTLRAEGNSTDFTMHSIVYTYRVTQDVPVFQYKSIASGSEGGDVYSSWESGKATAAEATHEQYDANVTNAASGLVQTAFFKAVPRTGYVFIGWKRKADDVDYVSTRAEYSEELISKSNDNAKPATITLYAVFSAKNTPLFSGSNQSLNVGANQVTDFAFQYTSSSIPSADVSTDFYYTIDQNPDATTKEGSEDATQVVSYDPTTKTLTGRNSGTAVITFTQKESANYYAASQSYNITVNKNTGTLTNNLGTAYKVDDAVNIVDCYTASNSEVEVQVASSNTNVIAVVDGQLKAVSVGTATVTFKQAETYKWTELTASQEITVTKYDLSASISQSAATWDATINNPFAISYGLNEYAVEALDSAIATYTNGAIQTYAETGTARFVISRAEDDKYNKLAETLSISVAPKTESDIIYQDNKQYDINYGNSHTYTVSNVLPGDVLTVDFWETNAATGGLAIYGYEENGTETVIMPNTEFSTTATTYPFTLAKAYTSIKIKGDGGTWSTLNKHCKNFTIRRNLHISADNSNVNMESTIGTNATATISLDYGSLGSIFKVVSDNPKISVSQTSFEATGNGTQEITLIGDATVLGTETATITIYDQSKKTTVNVTSTITRIPQTITWNSSFENLDVFSKVTLDATALGATEVVYSIAEGEQGKASIAGNVLSFNEAGTVHVVATAAQSDRYEGVSDTVSVEVRLAQPEVSQWPTATLTYGETLTGVVLRGESKIEGTFQWGDTISEAHLAAVQIAGEYTYAVKFVPTEGGLFNTLYGKATITIVEATQTISWENAPTACKVGERIALEAVASSGLAVEYYVDGGNYAMIDVDSNELVALAKGAIQLHVSQAGEAGKYAAAEEQVWTINIEAGTTTATEQVSANEQVMVRKVMRNGVLYILRDGQCYDTCGRLVDAE